MSNEQNENQTESQTQEQNVAPDTDIVSRVSRSASGSQPQDNDGGADGIKFDPKLFEQIQDPQQRSNLEAAYKQLQGDYTRKSQELAQQRKELEAKLNKPISVEDVREWSKRSDFKQAAEIVAQELQPNLSGGELSDSEWSSLSDGEKREFLQLKQGYAQISQEINSMKTQQEDQKLLSKYANYNPELVNQLYTEMQSGMHMNNIREHLWKVADYEQAIKRAYGLGREDANSGIAEKRSAINGIQGNNITPADDVPVRGEKENFRDHFQKIYMRNLERFKQSGQLNRK